MLHFEIKNFDLKCKGWRDKEKYIYMSIQTFIYMGTIVKPETIFAFCGLTAHFASSNFCELVILR